MIPEPTPEDSHDCPLCSDQISAEGLKFLSETLGPDPMLPAIKKFKMPFQDTPLRKITAATNYL